MTKSVLVDLALAYRGAGFSGIPQDSRLLFGGLARSDSLDVSGLIWSAGASWAGKRLSNLEEQSVFLGPHLGGYGSPDYSTFRYLFSRISPTLVRAYDKYFIHGKSSFDLDELASDALLDQVWRQFFSATLSRNDYKYVSDKKFYFTSTSYSRVADGVHRRLPLCKLNTNKHDVVVFQDSRAIKVSPNTQKVIRYHDGLPVFASDTMLNEWQTREHIRAIELCAEDSIYVCNSDSALTDLASISGKAAEKARVIPYFLPKMESVEYKVEVINDICLSRISPHTVKQGSENKVISEWLRSPRGKKLVPKYIMCLATLEPRKNFIGLISAWLKLRYETSEDIKLMIVGSPGWEFEPILKAMRPFIASSDLLHLEKVAQIELPYLYSAATCFVFPSFGEGFGLPPSEAMQCGCPVALSDIPAHRYSAGEAALFFDPYDIDDIVAKLKMLIVPSPESHLVPELIEKGYRNTQRYTVDAVLPQWEQLFDELSVDKY